MPYIKKEPIIEFITKGLNNPDKTKAFGHDAIEILTEIEFAPSTDVVPKSEVERLPHKCEECAGCTQWKCDCANIELEVAQEIFEEIEKILQYHGITIGLVFDEGNGADVAIGRIKKMIAELKKKYTEVQGVD